MKPKPGSLYIHSASEPYNEEQVLNQDRVDNWLDKFGMEHFRSRQEYQRLESLF